MALTYAGETNTVLMNAPPPRLCLSSTWSDFTSWTRERERERERGRDRKRERERERERAREIVSERQIESIRESEKEGGRHTDK